LLPHWLTLTVVINGTAEVRSGYELGRGHELSHGKVYDMKCEKIHEKEQFFSKTKRRKFMSFLDVTLFSAVNR